jgi:hypothetical protein
LQTGNLMATTYSEHKVALDEIAVRIRANAKRLQDCLNQATATEADLTAMQTAYNTVIADINADAVANPGTNVFTIMKAEKDQLVTEFNALKTRATNVKNAVNGVP